MASQLTSLTSRSWMPGGSMGRKSQTSRPLPPRNVSRPLPPRSSSLPAPPEQLIIQPRAEKHVSPIPADQVVAGSPSPDLIATFASRDLVTPAGPPAEERVITVTTTYQIRTSFGLNRVIRYHEGRSQVDRISRVRKQARSDGRTSLPERGRKHRAVDRVSPSRIWKNPPPSTDLGTGVLRPFGGLSPGTWPLTMRRRSI